MYKSSDRSDTPSDRAPKVRYSYTRFAELMADYRRRTGETVFPPPAVLAVVPLFRRSPRKPTEPSDVAVWLLELEDGRPMMVIEKPRNPDIPAVDVLLSHLGQYGQAHRDIVSLMIEATRKSRAANAKLERYVSMSHETVLKDALGGLATDNTDARRRISVDRRRIDFVSIFTKEFADSRARFVALTNLSARFIRRYGSGKPSSWVMDPRSIAIPTAFLTGFGRDGNCGYWIPPCDRLVERWDLWEIEYRAIEATHPRLPLLAAILDFRIASDQSGWPFSKRDPLLAWIDGPATDFPWDDALSKLGWDFPKRIRVLRICAGGWWRYDGRRGEVFYPC